VDEYGTAQTQKGTQSPANSCKRRARQCRAKKYMSVVNATREAASARLELGYSDVMLGAAKVPARGHLHRVGNREEALWSKVQRQ
jgi:hypothetical protein